jgi:hypothetical protein
VLLLRCARCGGALDGGDGDRVFTCPRCAAAFEPRSGALAEVPLRSLVLGRSARGAGRAAALPFWRVTFTPQIEAPSLPLREALEDVSSAGRAWVRAFWMSGAFHVGDPGQRLTEARFDETLAADGTAPSAGVRVGSAEALRLAELFLLAAADRRADVTGARLVLADPAFELVTIAFLREGEDLVSPVDGARWRSVIVPDLVD